jgi:hypothetical protein
MRLFVLLLAAFAAVIEAQAPLPPDINPVTLSRLPPATPEDLDEEGRKLLASRPAAKPGRGRHISRTTARGSARSAFQAARGVRLERASFSSRS